MSHKQLLHLFWTPVKCPMTDECQTCNLCRSLAILVYHSLQLELLALIFQRRYRVRGNIPFFHKHHHVVVNNVFQPFCTIQHCCVHCISTHRTFKAILVHLIYKLCFLILAPHEPGKFEPVCDKEGNFEPKQCVGEVCHCVDPVTGQPTQVDSITYKQGLECRKGVFTFYLHFAVRA